MNGDTARTTDEFFHTSTELDQHASVHDGDTVLAKRALDQIIGSARQRFGDTLKAIDGISAFRPVAGWREARNVRAQFKELDAIYIAALNAIVERAEYGAVGTGAGVVSFVVPKVTTKATAQITVVSAEWRAVHDGVNRLEATAVAMIAFYISILSLVLTLVTPFLLIR